MNIDIFNRRENKKFDPSKVYTHRIQVHGLSREDRVADLQTIIEAAWAAGVSKGSQRSGIFEVQTDDGIYSHINEKKIDPSKPNKVEFLTWDEIENEEG